ncbi:MAG: cellulose synthase family protein [Saprospiraceae bacterium]
MGAFEFAGYMVVMVYFIALLYVTIYCLMQFHLLYHYLSKNNGIENTKPIMDWNDGRNVPFVTIQLPIYNEKYVIGRLIDNICKLDYPKERYEIHILDDSTDDTIKIVEEKVKIYSAQGYQIEQIQRNDRNGYKAGALKDGMSKAKGKYIAIFDADFLPNPNFLKKTLPYFNNDKVGVVQTRWGHINRDYSILTKVQAFQLNVHFTIEQLGRQKGDYLLQFNGTAGVWRRDCIDSAGGWETDTLTEDLDLSYRAQLKGWKIEYLEDIVSPAELPAEMNGLKSQQYRWMKGGAETAVKVLPKVWKSNLSLAKKIYASSHLLSSSVFLFVFLLGVFSVPLTYFIIPLGLNKDYFAIFLIGLISIALVYYVANVQKCWGGENKLRTILKFICLFPVFMALSMGLSLHNAVAVIQGFRGIKSPFVRTPKFDVNQFSKKISNKSYISAPLSKITIAEGILAVYFALGLIYGLEQKGLTFTIMHLLLTFGYGTIFFYSLKHMNLK